MIALIYPCTHTENMHSMRNMSNLSEYIWNYIYFDESFEMFQVKGGTVFQFTAKLH